MFKKLTLSSMMILALLPVAVITLPQPNASADTKNLIGNTSIKANTGGFTGEIDSSNPLSPSIPLSSSEFQPKFVIFDIINGGTIGFILELWDHKCNN